MSARIATLFREIGERCLEIARILEQPDSGSDATTPAAEAVPAQQVRMRLTCSCGSLVWSDTRPETAEDTANVRRAMVEESLPSLLDHVAQGGASCEAINASATWEAGS